MATARPLHVLPPRLLRGVAVAAAWLVTAPAMATAADSIGDAANGQRLYAARCTSCHLMDDNDIGPAHRGVYGRTSASLRNFEYSPALRHKKVVWNDKTLDAWLAAPEKFAPGQSMGVSVKEPQARADLIAYLRTLKTRR